MATSEQCNQAWTQGYIAGYRSIRGGTPSVPSRPGTSPPGVDPIRYFYDKGFDAGVAKARS
jgi:hypothetical protein